MALIVCPGCEKSISDKAAKCPHCGWEPKNQTPEEKEVKKPLCEECGAELPEGAESCPNCGCPVENGQSTAEIPQKVELTAVNLPKVKKRTRGYIIAGVMAVAVLALAIVGGSNAAKKKAAEEQAAAAKAYVENLESASFTMLLGAIEAEEAGNLIKSVWANSIYEKRDSTTDKYTRPRGYFVDDFNDALANLFKDKAFQEDIETIEANRELVSTLMKGLINPPEEHENAYEALREFYDAYSDLTSLAINPQGNLQTYSQNFNEADSEVAKCYDAMNMYFD